MILAVFLALARLVAATCRDARRTLEGNEGRRCDARCDKSRQLNVNECEYYKAKRANFEKWKTALNSG